MPAVFLFAVFKINCTVLLVGRVSKSGNKRQSIADKSNDARNFFGG